MRLLLASTAALLLALTGPSLASAQHMDEVQNAISRVRDADPDIAQYFTNAAGYTVFPGVGKGGLGIGGGRGSGAAQETEGDRWNYIQRSWLTLAFVGGVFLDVTEFRQSDESRDQVGDLTRGERGEIRALRVGTAGQLRLGGYPIDFTFAGAYRGFDVGFDQSFSDDFSWFDFALGFPVLADARLNVGKQKEPFSHDRLQSMADNMLHERPAYLDALARARNYGVLLERWNADARWKWGVGYFNDWLARSGSAFSTNPFGVIGRVSGLVIDGERAGSMSLHAGASFNYTRRPEGTEGSVAAGPEVYFSEKFVETDPFAFDGAESAAIEAALIKGPWSVSGELLHLTTDAPLVGDPSFVGWHLQGSWVVTGERRGYNRRLGTLSGIVPDDPTSGGGNGALMLSARISHLDATEPQLDGGVMNKASLNARWFLSAVTWVDGHVGYVTLDRGGRSSGTWVFFTRLALLLT